MDRVGCMKIGLTDRTSSFARPEADLRGGIPPTARTDGCGEGAAKYARVELAKSRRGRCWGNDSSRASGPVRFELGESEFLRGEPSRHYKQRTRAEAPDNEKRSLLAPLGAIHPLFFLHVGFFFTLRVQIHNQKKHF